MYTIKKIEESHFEEYFRIALNSYPGFGFNKERYIKHLQEDLENPLVDDYGCFLEDRLVGEFSVHHFTMNYRGKALSVEGIGAVAVDLLHKKQHVCKEIIQWFCRYAKEQKSAMATLYPFRPDFYYQMGFGYGPQHFRYSIDPLGIPAFAGKENLRFLTEADIPLVDSCFHTYATTHHGVFAKVPKNFEGFFKRPNATAIGYFNGDTLEGYAFFSFKKQDADNVLLNNLDVIEWIFTTSQAFTGILAFFRSQADQCPRITLNTFDPSFYHLLNDVRNGSGHIITPVYHESNTAGVGLMYKIVDPPEFIRQCDDITFAHTALTIGWNLTDSLSTPQGHHFAVGFHRGKPYLSTAPADVTITCPITTFSSLWMGALSLDAALLYQWATISHPAMTDEVGAIFVSIPTPQCFSWF